MRCNRRDLATPAGHDQHQTFDTAPAPTTIVVGPALAQLQRGRTPAPRGAGGDQESNNPPTILLRFGDGGGCSSRVDDISPLRKYYAHAPSLLQV